MISQNFPLAGAFTCKITFFERQKRQAAGARLLRAGMSATDEADMPIVVGEILQIASPKLSAIMVNTTYPMSLAGLEAFERVRPVPGFGIGMVAWALFTWGRKNISSARLPAASRRSRTISQGYERTLPF